MTTASQDTAGSRKADGEPGSAADAAGHVEEIELPDYLNELLSNVEGEHRHAIDATLANLLDQQHDLERKAYTDALTNAANRAAYDRDFAAAWCGGQAFTLAFIDVDSLKECNDSFGHDEGNRYLIRVCAHIRAELPENSTLYRIGGDEFAVIALGVGEDALRERLEAARAGLVAESSPELPIVFSFSFGCSFSEPALGDGKRQMSLDADRKMYRYKATHKPKVRMGKPAPVTGLAGLTDRIFDAFAVALEGRYLFVYNVDTRKSRWSRSSTRMFGFPSEHPVDSMGLLLEQVHPDDREPIGAAIGALCDATSHFCDVQCRVKTALGSYLLCRIRIFRLDETERDAAYLVGVVTNRNSADGIDPVTGLGDYRALVGYIGECRNDGRSVGFVVAKLNDITGINSQCGQLAGDLALFELAGRAVSASRGRAHAFRAHGAELIVALADVTEEQLDAFAAGMASSLSREIAVNGVTIKPQIAVAASFYQQIRIQPYSIIAELDRRVAAAALANQRICEADCADCELEDMRIDGLTRLYYGESFLVSAEAQRRANADAPWCLAKVDLGHLRVFNEWYGRDRGNMLLAEIGKSLKDFKKDGLGVAGYWGKDDFCLAIPCDPSLIDELYFKLVHVIEAYDGSVGFRPAIGVYRLADGESIGIEQYTKALFTTRKAKHKVNNRVLFFQPMEYERDRYEQSLLADFRFALSRGEITFHMQPQCEINSKKIIGMEALARWRRADGTYVSPADFVPVLENAGLVDVLDKYIWQHVIEWMSKRLRAGQVVVPVSINVSRIDALSFDVAGFIEGLLTRYGVSACLLKAEITETAYVEDSASISELTAKLKKIGVAVFMDDFGSGLSSLAMLRTIDIDAIKFDRDFLPPDGVFDERGLRIVRSMIGMDRSMNLPAIIEGVENEKQVKLLSELGARFVQGFYFYRPMPVSDAERLLESNAENPC